MRRPLILATALAAELAVGTLVLVPTASAQTPTADPPMSGSVESGTIPPGTTHASDTASEPDPTPVRTGRSEPAAIPPSSPAPDQAAPDQAAPDQGAPDQGAPDQGAPDQPRPSTQAPEAGAPDVAVRSGRLSASAALGPASTRLPRDADTSTRSVPTGNRSAPASAARPGARSDGRSANGTPAPAAGEPTVGAPAAPPAGASTSHVVVAGDHLWAIAAQQVAAATGRDARGLDAREVVTYWVRVCMTNRPHLRSGDPNVIYAGEVIDLPSLA